MSVDLRGLLLRLLREDEEFRLAVMGLLGYADLKSSVDRLVEAVNELTKLAKAHDERLARLENAVEELTKAVRAHEERLTKVEDRLSRIEAAIEELTRAVKAHEDRLTRVEDRLTRLENAVEELTKAVKEQSRAIEELAKIVKLHEDRLAKVEETIKAFDRRLMALGARWGVESEEAFRNAMKGIVEGILGVATVGKWVYFDKDGVVYGYVFLRFSFNLLISKGFTSVSPSFNLVKLNVIGDIYD
ncbi:MAG: DUF3782 domain-containing protein [Vulcanisaeta sp.]